MPKYKLYEKEESIYDLLNIEFPLSMSFIKI